MNLLPEVKKCNNKNGFLSKNYIAPYCEDIDFRLRRAIDKLPCAEDGVKLIIKTNGNSCEKYNLKINENTIEIISDGLNGVFYGIQTLRQILKNDIVPCMYIEDKPDFEYRGLYHDISRGKIPKIDTLKKLIDNMAYYKMNSLQLYVEHTYEFKETMDIVKNTGCITKDEIEELDQYCYENFIEFIPSIATFGHMYEILEQEQYKHLRVYQDENKSHNFWRNRMMHHTIDPRSEESICLVKSLIDQYVPMFCSDKFNICGDETFDLEKSLGKEQEAKLYVDFIQKIVDFVKSKNKKPMMWADVLLAHPEVIEILPNDIYYLNWDYTQDVAEEKIETLARYGKKQIVCPGTTSWSRFCEAVELEEINITSMIEYGYKHGAIGVLNTNWGDYGNPASIELAMYGIILGAAKSWAVRTEINKNFHDAVNCLYYGNDTAAEYIRELSDLHTEIAPSWTVFCAKYFEVRYGEASPYKIPFPVEKITDVQKKCINFINELCKQKWENNDVKEEMIVCAEGLCVLAQLGGKLFGATYDTVVDVKKWVERYKEIWLKKNKESEISKIQDMLLYIDSI